MYNSLMVVLTYSGIFKFEIKEQRPVMSNYCRQENQNFKIYLSRLIELEQ